MNGAGGRFAFLPLAFLCYRKFLRFQWNQDLFHGYFKQCPKCVKIVDRGKAFSALPFVDCLRLFKSEIALQVADGEASFLAQSENVFSGRNRVDDGKDFFTHGAPPEKEAMVDGWFYRIP